VEAIDNLHCPIGVPGIAGKEPAIIAAAVAADLLLRCSEAQARRADSRGTDDENA
jgi:xanthine dehydrogenase accessory factor